MPQQKPRKMGAVLGVIVPFWSRRYHTLCPYGAKVEEGNLIICQFWPAQAKRSENTNTILRLPIHV